MKEKGILGSVHPLAQLVLLVILMLGAFAVTTFVGALAMVPFWGNELLEVLMGRARVDISEHLDIARYFQILTHLGLFIVPSILFAWLVGKQPIHYLEGGSLPRAAKLVLGSLIMLSAIPLVSLLMEFNMRLSLPEFMAPIEEWMVRSEEAAGELTKVFLNVSTWHGLLFNIFMIAVIPALGEEFIFRGILLKTFRQWSGKAHLAVWASAILFSAMHLQFFGFLPRLFLGVLLGYMFLWSGNIWVPVAGHFFNNALAVVMYFLFYNGYTRYDMEHYTDGFSRHPGRFLLALVSLLLVVGLFRILRKQRHETMRQ